MQSCPLSLPIGLQVDYKRPMPSNTDVVCTARVEKVEGRKVRWQQEQEGSKPAAPAGGGRSAGCGSLCHDTLSVSAIAADS